MFKNLIRLRILDFFELTAAIAGALYVYQSVAWGETERYWVASACAMAAVVIWCATRLGSTSPTPGLYVASYAGALYGLSDLSPWLVVFGRLQVMKAAIWLFPGSTPNDSWQGRLTTIAVISGLMILPAIGFAVTWLSGWNIIQALRKSPMWQNATLGRATLVVRWTIASVFVVGVGYYWLRPQIKYQGAIRLPIAYQTANDSSNKAPSGIQKAPVISDWTISPSGELVVLYSDMRIHWISLQTHRTVKSHALDSPEHRAYRKKHARDQARRIEHWDEDDSEYIRIWQFDPEKFLVSRTTQGKNSRTELDVYNLNTKADLLAPKPFVVGEAIEDISGDGKFVATRSDASQANEQAVIKVYASRTGRCQQTVERAKSLLSREYVRVESGSGDLQFPPSGFMCGGIPDLRHEFTWAAGLPGVDKQYSADGKFLLSESGLQPKNKETNLLQDFWEENVNVVLEPTKSRALLLSDWTLYLVGDFEFKLPILEHNLHDSVRSQPILFDANNRTYLTSWLRRDVFAGPRSANPKFTPDGRYFIIQDESNSADLFHIFSMP